MLFNFGSYSSLLLIFFVHGVVYCILLFAKSFTTQAQANRWLSFFLLVCILYIFPWMVGFAGWYSNQPYRDILFYTPFQHLFLLGPIVYFYVQSVLNPSFRFNQKDWLHFIPAIIYLMYCIIIVVYDRLIIKDYYFLEDGQDRDFDTWYQLAGFVSMLTYFIISIRYYNLYKKLAFQVISYAHSVTFSWVRNFLLAVAGFLILRLILFVANELYQMRYIDVWWYFLAFSIAFYYVAINGYANSVVSKIHFKPNLLSLKPQLLLPYSLHSTVNTVAEGDYIAIDVAPILQQPNDALLLWKTKITDTVVTQKLYEEPELSLLDVAKKLQTNVTVLSKAVNQGFGMNFNDFVNYYRVKAFEQLALQGEHKQQTLLSMAYECGFNSKATFNRAFKKVRGTTPKEWIESI